MAVSEAETTVGEDSPLVQVRNPRTGECDWAFREPGADEVERLCAEVRARQPTWEALGPAGRAAILRRWADLLLKDSGDLRATLDIDTGRALISIEEIEAVAHMIEGYAAQAGQAFDPRDQELSDRPGIGLRQQYVAYPVVGIISPWNFPFVLSFIDAIPALLAGCCVVIKPSEITPRFVDPLRDLIARVPELANVITMVRGGPPAGQALVDAVDLIVFTGSIPVGRRIAEAAARRMIPAYLELGGKDPAVVLEGADLERAAEAIVRSAVYNNGQVCYSIERVYVAEREHGPLLDLLVEKVGGLSLSCESDDPAAIGPFIHRPQAQVVADQLADAVAKGASILCGGTVQDHGGLWMRPAVVSGVTHDMRLMCEETFGPVVPVMAFRGEDEAIRLANDSDFGLSGAVFGPDIATCQAVAERIDAGGISLNDTELTRAIAMVGEKMAFRMSGMGGSRYGPGAMFRYVRKKALIRNRG